MPWKKQTEQEEIEEMINQLSEILGLPRETIIDVLKNQKDDCDSS
jgi:hypothetical protein